MKTLLAFFASLLLSVPLAASNFLLAGPTISTSRNLGYHPFNAGLSFQYYGQHKAIMGWAETTFSNAQKLGVDGGWAVTGRLYLGLPISETVAVYGGVYEGYQHTSLWTKNATSPSVMIVKFLPYGYIGAAYDFEDGTQNQSTSTRIFISFPIVKVLLRTSIEKIDYLQDFRAESGYRTSISVLVPLGSKKKE